MSQVSRRPLSKELEDRMNEILWKSLAHLGETSEVANFLEDILTPTERTMIMKRLAIALLLSRGWDQESISHYLKVSTTTVQNLKKVSRLSKGGLALAISQIEKESEWEQIKLDLAQTLEEIWAGRVGANWKQSKPGVRLRYASKRQKYKVL